MIKINESYDPETTKLLHMNELSSNKKFLEIDTDEENFQAITNREFNQRLKK